MIRNVKEKAIKKFKTLPLKTSYKNLQTFQLNFDEEPFPAHGFGRVWPALQLLVINIVEHDKRRKKVAQANPPRLKFLGTRG